MLPRGSPLPFFNLLRWIDGNPLLTVIEPYRQRIFTEAFSLDDHGRRRYNLVLCGRAKKNWKSADLVLAALHSLIGIDSPNGNQVYLLANDEGQASDDLLLAQKLVSVNSILDARLKVRQKSIERKDGTGFLEVLPANDVHGSHGKTYCFAGFDEIHGYRSWDILEAMQLDPTRPEAMMWITSYATMFHKPGVPLFDLCLRGWAKQDRRMFFSWYAADRTTDEVYTASDPETRANPSRASWKDPNYLEQQQARLPAHKYRRLHLNLPGLPEGSAYQPEPIIAAVIRGVAARQPEKQTCYKAFVDMSGGSSDDAVLAIGHNDADGRAVVDLIVDQGPKPPFDPRAAVSRFVEALRRYGIVRVRGDRYAGETFKRDFEGRGITYETSTLSKSQLYEAFEPHLNSNKVVLPDVHTLEQQLMGLVWRGGKIDHPPGEHDDWANAAAGLANFLFETGRGLQIFSFDISGPVAIPLPLSAQMTEEEKFLWGTH
jgi:hypothetical protein